MALLLRHLNRIFCLCLCAACSLHAQPSETPPGAVAVSFTVFAPRAIKGLAYLPNGNAEKTPTPLKFYNSYRSPAYLYEGPAELCFYDASELAQAIQFASTQDAPGHVRLPKPVARCVIPEGVREAFLLFVRAEGGRGYDIVVMDEGDARLPPGHVVVINVSGLDLVARINGKTTSLPAGVGNAIPAKNGVVSLAVARTEPRFRRLVVSDRWDLGPRQRDRLIIFPPSRPTALLPELVRLSDVLPARPEATSAGNR